MKSVVEKTESQMAETTAETILQEVSNQIAGKKQMSKLLEQTREAANATLLFE